MKNSTKPYRSFKTDTSHTDLTLIVSDLSFVLTISDLEL